jgi:cell wall-associated NlpC family hydrolase
VMVPPDWCREFVELQYRDRGRGPVHYDCWGFVRLVERAVFGVFDLPDLADQYASSGDHAGVAAVVSRYKQALGETWVPVTEPGPGDIVILSIATRPWHCGICVGGGWMMHMMKDVNVGLERYGSWTWRNRIEGFYRHAA